MKIDTLSHSHRSSERRRLPRAALLGAWCLALAAVVVCLGAIAPLGRGLILAAVVVWFSAPGFVAASLLYAPGPGRGFSTWIVGPIWGYGLSSIVLLGLWVVGLRGPVLLIAPALAAAVAVVLGMLLRSALSPRPFGRSDVIAALLLIGMVPAIVGLPFSRVAAPVEDGRAYRAYFTADMVWRMAVVAELAKGDVPPRNPFYRGDRLRYYWLAHLLPAAELQIMQRQVTLEQVLLVNSVMLGLSFVLFLYGFVRQWVNSAAAAAVACASTFLFTSFEGAERLLFLWRQGQPFELVRTLNIDAVTRWFYQSLPVDGLQRLLWYQPHHSTGYALGLSALLVLAQVRGVPTPPVLAFCGVLLGLCLLLSTFSAIMFTVMVALVASVMLVRARQWATLVRGGIAGAIPLAVAVWIATALRYVDDSGASVLRILVNPMAVTNTTTALMLSFGPLLIGAVVGTSLAVFRRPPRLAIVGAIVLVSFLFYFFVDVRDHQYVYVGWRAGHLLFAAFAVLTGYALQEFWRRRGAIRTATLAVALLLAGLSFPTFAIDFYNTQDIANRAQGPGFRWTLVLTHDELAALDWIRATTRPNAIVQVEPHVRDAMTWAYVPAFAQRRMSAGLPISMVPLQKYQAASASVRALYEERDPAVAYERAARLGIDYVIIAPPEREAYPGFDTLLAGRPDLFREVFRRGEVAIYYVEGGYVERGG